MRGMVKRMWDGHWEALAFLALLVFEAVYFNVANGLPVRVLDVLLFTSAIGLLLLTPTAFMTRRFRVIALFILALFATIVLVANQLYYRYYQDLITIPSLLLAGQVYGVRGSILPLAKLSDLLFALPAFFFGALCLKLPRPDLRRTRARILTALMLLALGMTLFVSRYVPMIAQWENAVPLNVNYLVVGQTGLYAFHLIDFQRFVSLKANKAHLDNVATERILDYFRGRELRPNALTGLGRGMNLMVVQLESFESFPVGMRVDGQEITPNLNRLAQESLYFPNIYYQTAKGNTSDAEFMLNNSLLPLRDGAVNYFYAENDYYPLPMRLKERGYTPLAFHPYGRMFWNRSFVYPRLGFEKFYSRRFFQQDQVFNLGLSDESFYRQTLEFLKDYPEPFYAQLITLTSHHPYLIPTEHRHLTLPDWLPIYLQDYLQAIHYADKAIGTLLRALEAQGLKDRTVLVLYGDHEGASFQYFNEIRRLQARPLLQDEALARARLQTVPLFIRVPGSAVRGTVEQAGGQIDILPTINNLMGLRDDGIFLGEDLVGTKRWPIPLNGRLPLGSFAEQHRLFVASPDGVLERGAYYDLRTEMHLPVQLAAKTYRTAQEMYDVSQHVIKLNLVGRLRNHDLANGEERNLPKTPKNPTEGS